MDGDAWHDGYSAGFGNGWHEMAHWIMLWMDEERYEADGRKDVNMVRFIDRFISCLDEYENSMRMITDGLEGGS